jgi:hypothetical protein
MGRQEQVRRSAEVGSFPPSTRKRSGHRIPTTGMVLIWQDMRLTTILAGDAKTSSVAD